MPHSLRFLLVLLTLAIIACGPSDSEEGETVSVDPAEVGYATEDEPEQDNQLALEPGLYVPDGADCADSADTDLWVWTGQGLESSATSGCKFEISSREGEVYKGRQNCSGTNGDAGSAQFSIEVLEPGSIILTEGEETTHLTLCPEGETPDWVREKLVVD